MRLDDDVWAPTPLGTCVPHGLLQDVAHGGEQSYRPLLHHHRVDGWIEPHMARAVQLIEDEAAWEALGDEPEVAAHRHPGAPTRWREGAVAVVLRDVGDGRFSGVILTHPSEHDPRLSRVALVWLVNVMAAEGSFGRDVLAAAWLSLFRALARRGVVGVEAAEAHLGRRYVAMLREVAGFRPAGDELAARGLSPADAQLLVARWRATVEDAAVTAFDVSPGGEAARRAMLEALDRYFSVMRQTDGDLPPQPGLRITIGGAVALDGVRGWGNHPVGDWPDQPDDVVPDDLVDWAAHATTALRRWLRRELAGPGRA